MRLIVGITGASGVIYGIRLIETHHPVSMSGRTSSSATAPGCISKRLIDNSVPFGYKEEIEPR